MSVTWMEVTDQKGWYVAIDLADGTNYGNFLMPEGNTLHGNIVPEGENGKLVVTVAEEGANGLLLVTDTGKSYHLTPMELPEASIVVSINTEGLGHVAYAESEDKLSFDEPFTSHQFGLEGPAKIVIGADTKEPGWGFIKWTLNGKDYSTDPVITVEISEDSEFVAEFAYVEEDGQGIAINYIGDYVCDRAQAHVELLDDDRVKVTIRWGGGAKSEATWTMTGKINEDKLSLYYTDSVKKVINYKDDGSVESEKVEYENGTGHIKFKDNYTIVWLDDQGDSNGEMVFEQH